MQIISTYYISYYINDVHRQNRRKTSPVTSRQTDVIPYVAAFQFNCDNPRDVTRKNEAPMLRVSFIQRNTFAEYCCELASATTERGGDEEPKRGARREVDDMQTRLLHGKRRATHESVKRQETEIGLARARNTFVGDCSFDLSSRRKRSRGACARSILRRPGRREYPAKESETFRRYTRLPRLSITVGGTVPAVGTPLARGVLVPEIFADN